MTLGDGATASFWFDSWLPDGAPFLLAPNVFQLSRRKNRCVRDALQGSRWVQDLRERITAPLLHEFVSLWGRIFSSPGPSVGSDTFRWKLAEKGSYSAASAYRLQFLGSTSSPIMDVVWKSWAPLKCKFFAWLLSINRILTADRLMARHWPNCYFCPLCRRNLETGHHLFTECLWVLQYWRQAAAMFGVASFDPDMWSGTYPLSAWLLGLAGTTKRGRSIALFLVWFIWKERNARIFDDSDRTVQALLHAAKEEFLRWVLTGGRHLMPQE